VLLEYLKAQKRAGTKKHCSFFVKRQKVGVAVTVVFVKQFYIESGNDRLYSMRKCAICFVSLLIILVVAVSLP